MSTVTRFAGFAVREDAGGAAQVNFRHGNVGGQIIWPLDLTANEPAAISFGAHIPLPNGLYIEEVSGSISGVAFQAV